jgi:hypothetical protein
MRNKRESTSNKRFSDLNVLCQKCGNYEFKRTFSETDSIVHLVYTAKGKAVIEIVITEGKVQFSYRCAKCGAPLLLQK